jgi:SET domain-containing protein
MSCPFYTALSPIHGRGLFANRYFSVGEVLFKVSDPSGNVTDFGRWVNHSWAPNIILHTEDDGQYAVASLPIYQGREILGNYKFTPSCFDKPYPGW